MKKLLNFFLFIFALFVKADTLDGGDTHQELNYAELLTPGLRQVFYRELQAVPEVYSKIYHMNNSSKYEEKDFYMGAMAPWDEFGSSTAAVAAKSNMPVVPFKTVAKGFEQAYRHKEFAQGFLVEKKFIDDEQYGIINKMAADLAAAGRTKVEMDGATFLETTSFGVATLNRTVDETLFHAAHTLVSSAATYSNLMTDKLGYESLRTAIKTMKKMPDEAGNPCVMIPNLLIVPVDLEDTAKEILKTMKKPGSTENDINTIEGIDILVHPYLTSTVKWYLLDTRRHKLNWFWRIRPIFDKEKDFDSLVTKWSGYMRYSLGATDWRGIIGSTGAGAAVNTYYSYIKNISEKMTAAAASLDAIDTNTEAIATAVERPDPAEVAIVYPAVSFAHDATLQLHGLVFPASADQSVLWVSSDLTKATVSATGLVTGVADGAVTITCKAAAKDTITKTLALTVT